MRSDLTGIRGIPDADEASISVEAFERPKAPFDSWVAVSNGVDFQHLSSALIEPGWSAGHFVVGVPKGEAARLPEVKAMVEQLSA